jgi:hypothetical protein
MAAPTKGVPAASANGQETFPDSPLLPIEGYKLPGPPSLGLKSSAQPASDGSAPTMQRDQPQKSVEREEPTAETAAPANGTKTARQSSPVREDDASWEGRTSREDSFTSSTPALTTGPTTPSSSNVSLNTDDRPIYATHRASTLIPEDLAETLNPYHNLSPAEASHMGAEAATQAEGEILVDESATDAGYESDTASSASTSLSSSVREYLYENGRRYHKFREGRYNFPNDDVEQEREDMKHAMVKMLCQQLYFAPIGDHPQEILDIGTGTGIWAIESRLSSGRAAGIRSAMS